MRHLYRIALAATAVSLAQWGCKTSQPAVSNTPATASPDAVIATIGPLPIYRSEFKYVYEKNSGFADTADRAKSVQDYLDLYLNFRLKVKEAEDMGLDTAASFRQELAGYRDQLAEPYMVDSSITRLLIREAYEHLKEEVRASHILIAVPPEAPPEDTLKAYRQITEIRQKAAGGQDFTELARANSQDPSAQANGGDLGYFTALQMVYAFEKTAFQTPVGSVSPPVRTKFGYHVLKVTARRPSRGKLTVAHIMVRTNPEVPEAEAKAAKRKIDEIYKKVKQGDDWDKLCVEFSEDGNSRAKGGVLQPFSTGNTIPAFEDAAFALAKPGDISQPVLTPYGWHVIKLIERKGLEPLAQLQPMLQQKVGKDSRSELNRRLLLERLRREDKLAENAEASQWAFAQANDSLKLAVWNYATGHKNLQQTLFSIKNQPYTTGDFFKHVKASQQPREKLSAAYQMQLLYTDFVNQSLIKYEKDHLEEKYPDFKYLVNEYHDGILLFQRMETEVWSKSLADSTGQKQYFEANKDKYRWQQRVTASLYNAADNSILAEAKTLLARKPYPVSEPKFAELSFAKNSSTLTASQKQQLDRMAQTLAADKSLLLDIAAHADRSEKPGVSAARNTAVSSYLTQHSADITQLVIRDFNTSAPVSRTDAKRNSRVAFASASNSKTAVEQLINAKKPLSLEITEGIFQKGDNPLIDRTTWQPGNYTLDNNGRVAYIEIAKVEEPRQKTFEESRGQVVSDYQAYLEKTWLDRLRKRYPVAVVAKEVEALKKAK